MDREARAKNLLNDPLYTEAFEKLEEEINNTWYNSSVKDVESREQL